MLRVPAQSTGASGARLGGAVVVRFRCGQRRSGGGEQSLLKRQRRLMQLTAEVLRGAHGRVQNLVVMVFFHVGKNSRSRRDEVGADRPGSAHGRKNHRDENSAGDAGGEKQQIGNPVAHFRWRFRLRREAAACALGPRGATARACPSRSWSRRAQSTGCRRSRRMPGPRPRSRDRRPARRAPS